MKPITYTKKYAKGAFCCESNISKEKWNSNAYANPWWNFQKHVKYRSELRSVTCSKLSILQISFSLLDCHRKSWHLFEQKRQLTKVWWHMLHKNKEIIIFVTATSWNFVHCSYLDVLVVLLEVHKSMVGSDSLRKCSNISAYSDVVLPDLPMFIVTLEGFLQGMKGFCPNRERTKVKVKWNSPLTLVVLASPLADEKSFFFFAKICKQNFPILLQKVL